MKTIVICCSGNFYKHANEVADELIVKDFKVIVPKTADIMRKSGDYDIDKHKTWYDRPEDFTVKAGKMRKHFEEVAAGDIILVINDEKRGIKGYIGPNGLMEMGLAFYLNKPIYVLNPVGKGMPFYEEVLGMDSIILNGDLGKIK